MREGFIRVASATPEIKVADCLYNTEQIQKCVDNAVERGVKILALPELCITGYTLGDLFLQTLLLEQAKEALIRLASYTVHKDILVFVGLPMEWNGSLYNVAAALFDGEILGLIPKKNIPNYGEFYEARHFTPGIEKPVPIQMGEREILFGSDQLFCCQNVEGLIVAAEICEDLWVPSPPSIRHALAGANIIVNPSAGDETTGKSLYRRDLVSGQSARLICAYLYASAGEGESSTDLVFSAHNIIAENGTMLAESKRFQNEMIVADVDLDRLRSERRRMTTFLPGQKNGYVETFFSYRKIQKDSGKLLRYIESTPFVPKGEKERNSRCEEIFSIQSMGLKKRLKHTGCKNAVIGISGGLDSTLALLVTARAFDRLSMPRNGIIAVTMPCFGTTDRTYQNALLLSQKLGAELIEVDLKEAVMLHFRDIGQDAGLHDITYENSQARERTQILMDIANKKGGMVIGTGDMSELALGWATYNGDHMSMYGVNASVPKTLVRHLVRYYADSCKDQELADVLYDILDTPVSPELLPPENGKIAQKTEDIVGPYELHDFFLYYVLRFGYRPRKIFALAAQAFEGIYGGEVIKKWMYMFYRRFFSQQFKRSCLPDGPKVGSVAVSPRGDLRMPSDACARMWLEEVEAL